MKTRYFLLAITFIASCQPKQSHDLPDPEVLISADQSFSDLSEKEGMKTAFLSFAHDSVVIVRDGAPPLKGIQNLSKQYESITDTGFVLSWKPTFSSIANSGELGYTYGFYTLNFKADSLKDEKGTYVSIWKMDHNGEWKFILDIGNKL